MSENVNKKTNVEKEDSYDWKRVLINAGVSFAQAFAVGFVTAAGAKAFDAISRGRVLGTNNVVNLDTRKAV